MIAAQAVAAFAALLSAAAPARSDRDWIAQFRATLNWPAHSIAFEITVADDAPPKIVGLRYAMRTGSPITAANWDDAGTIPLPDPASPLARPGEKISWSLAIDASLFDHFPSGATVYFAAILTDLDGMDGEVSDPNATITVPVDLIPPAGTDMLEAQRTSPGSLQIRWPTPGDDGLLGAATRYVLLSSSRPLTAADFGDPGIDVERIVTPAPSNPLATSSEIIVLTEPVPAPGSGSMPARHFALVTEDEAGNRSPMSNDGFVPGLIPSPPRVGGGEARSTLCAALPLGGSLAVLAAILLLPNIRRSARG